MEPFVRLTSIAAPLPEANVDTDVIVPARFLLITEKKGLGRYAFYERREGGGFVLDDPAYSGAQVLVAGPNFGCGSSREHAPWALNDLGIRCIIAPSFGEIFRANCVRNGMLPIRLEEREWAQCLAAAQAQQPVTVDLTTQMISTSQIEVGFAIPPAEREALLNGWDEIDGIRAKHSDAIAAFENGQRATLPWLWEKKPIDG